MNETLLQTIQTIDQIVPNSGYLAAFAKMSRNPLWPKAADETKLQFMSILYMRVFYPEVLVVHPENEQRRTGVEKFLAKYNGVRAGMPDIMVFKQAKRIVEDSVLPYLYAGLAIELKIGKNTLSEDQAAVFVQLASAGWKTHLIRDLPQFIRTVKIYFNEKV